MCTNTKTLTSLKLATKTPQHFLFFSGFVLILSSSFSLSVYMNDSACICAGSIHKRPSVQSDKVPISKSCDSDFLSVCQTAAEGLSIRARAHILSHLLKHKLTRARREAWKPLSSSSFFCCSVCHGGEDGKTLSYFELFSWFYMKIWGAEVRGWMDFLHRASCIQCDRLSQSEIPSHICFYQSKCIYNTVV